MKCLAEDSNPRLEADRGVAANHPTTGTQPIAPQIGRGNDERPGSQSKRHATAPRFPLPESKPEIMAPPTQRTKVAR